MIGSTNTLIDKKGFYIIPDITEYDSWIQYPMITDEYTLYSSVVYNDELYLLATNKSDSSNGFYKWDGLRFNLISPLPDKLMHVSAVVYNNEIHLLGSDILCEENNYYKWDGKNWIKISTLPYKFIHSSAVVYNGEIHLLGGIYNSFSHYKWNGSSWVNIGKLPMEYIDTAVVYNDEIHAIFNDGKRNYYYTYNGSNWKEISTVPYNFLYTNMVVYKNEIHLFGDTDKFFKNIKWDGITWVDVSDITEELYASTAVVYNDEIHLIGSKYSDNKFVHFVLAKRLWFRCKLPYGTKVLAKGLLCDITTNATPIVNGFIVDREQYTNCVFAINKNNPLTIVSDKGISYIHEGKKYIDRDGKTVLKSCFYLLKNMEIDGNIIEEEGEYVLE